MENDKRIILKGIYNASSDKTYEFVGMTDGSGEIFNDYENNIIEGNPEEQYYGHAEGC